MAEIKLDVLEKRLDELEKRIFGSVDKDVAYPRDSPEVIDTLASLNYKVNTVVSERPRIEKLLKRLGELEKYLDPAYTEKLTLSNDAKTEIVLAEEELIRQHAADLEKLKNMCDVLSSEHIKVVPALENKLQELSKIHIEQQDQASELTEDTKNLLLQYNNIITTLSKQFVQWDETVTKLEIASQPKKVLD